MKNQIELLAPGGDIDSIKAAIIAGADAVYCGLNKFNARNRATNIALEDLPGIVHLAHRNTCKVFLTLNILIAQSEFPYLVSLLNKLINTGIDAIIVQDLGLLYLLSNYFKGFILHASTQLNTHNEGQIHFLHKLSAARVTLSRELNISEIKALTLVAQQHNISTEVFVHGSYCISFSGICYLSSFLKGTSGNRGKCSQPCRDRYLITRQGKNYPLNLKDNSAYSDLRELCDAGVASIKIEGRIKNFDYVYTVVGCWKKQLTSFYQHNSLNNEGSDLYKVFNRDFSNAYLRGDINKDMFIDNPRDNSIQHLSDINTYSTNNKREEDQRDLYEEKDEITTAVKHKINHLSIAKVPLTIRISGRIDTPLKVSVTTPDTSFIILSKNNLVHAGTYTPDQGGERETPPPGSKDLSQKTRKSTAECLNYDVLFGRLKALNTTEYHIEHLELEDLESDLFISFKELSSIKKKLLYFLNGSKEFVDPIEVPFLKKQPAVNIKPTLAVLISSKNDLYLCDETSADIFFQLPGCFKNDCCEFIDLFLKNKKLIPWFPAVLLGENYRAAVKFLQQVQPERIVTNNTGIAYEAYKKGIPWIAGPCLNIVNSFSLLCLKENFNCSGSFISNELNKYQIQRIITPENFKLYYSIYHPGLLLSSRQCLFHQVIGCDKNSIDEDCLETCNKSSSITNLNNVSLFIEKTKGNYPCLYNNHNFLNTDIVTDLPDTFSGFLIDLRDITTETTVATDKSRIIKLFENLLHGDPDSKEKLRHSIHPSTNAQYKKGI